MKWMKWVIVVAVTIWLSTLGIVREDSYQTTFTQRAAGRDDLSVESIRVIDCYQFTGIPLIYTWNRRTNQIEVTLVAEGLTSADLRKVQISGDNVVMETTSITATELQSYSADSQTTHEKRFKLEFDEDLPLGECLVRLNADFSRGGKVEASELELHVLITLDTTYYSGWYKYLYLAGF